MDEVFLEQLCLNVPLLQDFSSIILRVVVMWVVVMIGRGRLVLRGWGRMVATTVKGLVRLTSAMILKHSSFTWSVSKEEGHPKCNNSRKSPNTAPYRTWKNNTRRCDTNMVNKLLIPTNRFVVNALLKTEELQKIRLFFIYLFIWIRFWCCVQNTVTEQTLH